MSNDLTALRQLHHALNELKDLKIDDPDVKQEWIEDCYKMLVNIEYILSVKELDE